MTDAHDLIGSIVNVEIAGRTIDAVVQDVRTIHDRLAWRDELLVTSNGSSMWVSADQIVP